MSSYVSSAAYKVSKRWALKVGIGHLIKHISWNHKLMTNGPDENRKQQTHRFLKLQVGKHP